MNEKYYHENLTPRGSHATSGPSDWSDPGQARDPTDCEAAADGPIPFDSTLATIGVYVHFPWCKRKCAYCDFYSVAEPDPTRHSTLAYADQIVAECAVRLRDLDVRRVDSIYFGGGTSSLWETKALARVLEGIAALVSVDLGRSEITVEANPSSLDQIKALEWLGLGINRVSLGIQSLDDVTLHFLGRIHDRKQALACLNAVLEVGFPRVSADLIFGVPGAGVGSELSDASELAARPLTHLSLYALSVEPGTALWQRVQSGTLAPAGEDHVADTFLSLHQLLGESGFEHYEISNYARYGHTAAHNLGIWRGGDYLGLGPAAVGTVQRNGQRLRYRNRPDIERYLRADLASARQQLWELGPDSILEYREVLGPELELREALMLGLRLREGVDFAALCRRPELRAATPQRLRAIRELVAGGRLSQDQGRLCLSPSNWLLSNDIIARLF